MHAVVNKPVNETTKTRSLIRRHPRRSLLVVFVVLVLIGAGITLWATLRSKPQKISSNPVVAGYQRQLPALKQAVQKDGNDPQARYNYAVALYATKDVAGAKDQYVAEAKLTPNDPALENNLGNVYRDLADYKRAVDAYQKAIRLDPKASNSYINLASLYLYTLNQKDLAIKTYQDGLRNLPGNQDLEVLLGIAYEQSGDKSNARTTYQQVLNQNSNNATAKAGLKRIQ